MNRVRLPKVGLAYRFLHEAVRLRAQELWTMDEVHDQLLTRLLEHLALRRYR